MGLFRRFGDILSANLNDLVDRFEEPEKMLRQAIREMDQAVASALNGAAKVVANEKLLAKQLAENRRQAERWHDRARQAVQGGDDALARRALARKAEHERLIPALEDELAATADAGRKLRRQIDGMRSRLAEAKRKLATLSARQKAADARRMWGAVAAGETPEATFSKFDRLCRRIEFAEAEAEALVELARSEEDDTDPWNETADAQIDEALAELKYGAAGPTD